MTIKIDYDRGVQIRAIQSSGMNVYMYDDEPGIYRLLNGQIAPESFAAEAGFDTERLGRERIKRDKLRKAFDDIERESAVVDAAGYKIVAEREGYELVDIGLGRYIIRSDGANLTPVYLPEVQAKRMFDELAGPEQEAPAPVQEKGKVKPNGGSSA